MPPPRVVVGELAFARRIPSALLPPTRSLQSKQGLRYQRRVTRALAAFAAAHDYEFEAEPWFTFRDDAGEGLAVPDALLLSADGAYALAVEVKWTYTPAAFTKLALLYAPLVAKALARPCAALVVAQHMARGAPHGAYGMAEALRQPEPVLHWLGHGAIPA